MNKVILFHEYHFGDIFFSVEIIKNIVNCNPHLKISVMNKENAYYLYSDIENIESYVPHTEIYYKEEGRRFSRRFRDWWRGPRHKSIAWKIIDNILLINIWCAGGKIHADCRDIGQQQNRIIQIIDQINLYSKNIEMLILEFHWLDRNEDLFIKSLKKLQENFDIIHLLEIIIVAS